VIAESKARLGTGGRLVIRESGTEPVIRVMAESDDRGLVEAVVAEITSTIRQVA
jgi:phosphoglucosamine mutase